MSPSWSLARWIHETIWSHDVANSVASQGTICTKCYDNPSIHQFQPHDGVEENPLGTWNICTKFNESPSNSCWNVSVWTEVVDQHTDHQTNIPAPDVKPLAWLKVAKSFQNNKNKISFRVLLHWCEFALSSSHILKNTRDLCLSKGFVGAADLYLQQQKWVPVTPSSMCYLRISKCFSSQRTTGCVLFSNIWVQ